MGKFELSQNELKYKIELLRRKMIEVGLKERLGNEKTILISKRLDIYLSKYQALKR